MTIDLPTRPQPYTLTLYDPSGTPTVVTVYDTIPFLAPDGYSAAQRLLSLGREQLGRKLRDRGSREQQRQHADAKQQGQRRDIGQRRQVGLHAEQRPA